MIPLFCAMQIELGCHEGVTTQLIALCGCEFVLGVDKSAFSIARANKRLQKLRHSNAVTHVQRMSVSSSISLFCYITASW